MKKSVVVLVSILAAACASNTKPVASPAPVASSGNIGSARAENVATAPVSTPEVGTRKLADEIQALQHQSVYFNFDQFNIKPEYEDVIKKQAEFLKMHTGDVVTVEGNADERGSNEYNLGLGDRRAKAVEKDLELLGVPASQIKVISFGSEKPRLLCHQEECWKENRRDDFVHKLN
jgi:peptidoglycan-associated lipoprotein